MPEEIKKNCEACGQRPATQYDIYGDTGQVRGLCASCFEGLASPGEATALHHAEQALINTRCDYCGAPAVKSSVYSPMGDGTNEEISSWCEQCYKDLMEFASCPENAIADFDVADAARLDEESRRLEERELRKKEFMRRRVMAREHQ